ncbi:EAL domain-containing protein [Vibrio rhodolitus]|uniref:EAL domain-containing protein n=1 Tax=Vibrio rhodolitus TaxID=2231649 RepID=UPI000E0A540B|nr:EAL domain-containing protein [Vibrio rhodolitus]
MYIFGLLVYITIPALAYYFDGSREFIYECFELSPEITALIAITYLYPISVFCVAFFFRHHKFANIEYFRSQVTLSSSLAVSFGLIGTFVGLANMISGIAAGLNASGDFTERMALLLNSIGLALDSMSLAFLTSILGVGTSVSILVASNYLNSFFDLHQVSSEGSRFDGDRIAPLFDTEQNIINQNFEQVHVTLQQTLELVHDKEKTWTDLHTLLESNSGSTVVKQFNQSLDQHNQIALNQAEQMQSIREEQLRTNQKMEQFFAQYAENMNSLANEAAKALSSMSGRMETMAAANENMEKILAQHAERMGVEAGFVTSAVDGMSNRVVQMSDDITRTQQITTDVIEQTSGELDRVASILHDIRIATALPIGESLKNAIHEGSFSLVYQPQTRADGSLIGAEAFIRWIDPVRGPISNYELFKLAKQEGVSVEVELWVVHSTIHQVSKWQKQGCWQHEWIASINATSELLLSPNFVNDIEINLKKSGVNPGSIAIEITEDTISGNSAAARDKIRQLHNLGLKTFIDDFGTGYTSLINLRDFEIDRLKIDRDIINGISEGDESSFNLVKSVMMMAEQMNIQVQAEGVEVQQQVDKLVEVGCEYFQGYHFGKPVASSEFESQYLTSEQPVLEAEV